MPPLAVKAVLRIDEGFDIKRAINGKDTEPQSCRAPRAGKTANA